MEKLFHLKENGTNVKTEVMAGITTFLAMAYILAVNPSMLGDAGMNSQGVFMATALAAAVATIVMALLANYPIALASGMGLNAYFAYTICLGELADQANPWQIALTAILVEGIIFIILSAFKFRETLVNCIPENLKYGITTGIGLFIMMFYYSWQLSIILIVLAPIVSIAIRVVSKRFRNISKNMQNTMGQVTTSAEQMLKGHKEVLIFGGQEVETKRFDKVSNRMRLQGMKMVSASSISDPIIQLIASLALAFVLYAASFPSVMDSLTAGTITVVFSSMIALMRPLKSLTNVNAQFQRGMAACQTLFTILDSEQEKDEGKRVIERATGDVEFRNVTFTYPGRDVPALRNINLKIPAGKTVALVGRSGSGKSTIASLITRFYDIDEGEILMDGHDLREYTLASLRNQVALVSQNVHLFNDTVANNIAYARTEQYSREQIEEAARMAYAMDFINKMDNGLDTVIGENGVLLSGGQRQRIAIARALLRDSPILILDEATSALDTESERAIQAALDELQKNRTSLVIAHRLSTIEKADEIVVVEDGVIVERGTHNDLLEHRGVYAQLHKMQFGQ